MFEITDSKVESARQALDVRDTIRDAYESARTVRDLLALHGTDPTYTAAVNAIYPAGERVELAAVAGLFAALVADLEANHADVIRVSAP